MDKSVDHITLKSAPTRTPKAAQEQTRILFVTDPLCSWCFGTLPEVLSVREQLGSKVQFDIVMGGLQIGTPEGLLGYDIKRLIRLWNEVTATTGQVFSGRIPEGFVYHSELSCRAVEIAREINGEPPFDFFSKFKY